MSVRRLVSKLVAAEDEARRRRLLAPCLPGGRIRVKVSGLILTLRASPADFEGWGFFRAVGERTAELEEEAELPWVLQYLERLRSLRAWLACPLRGRTWLAYPAGESDARQRGWPAQPIPVHLVSEAAAFERIVARYDGRSWWCQEVDRRSDPRLPDSLRKALAELIAPDDLRLSGLTPELRTAYALATQQDPGFEGVRAQRNDERRLRRALEVGGGEFHGFVDRGDYWVVEWSTAEGHRHSSAISCDQLTVLSAGICLDDRDRDFDLESLVGVMEGSDGDGW